MPCVDTNANDNDLITSEVFQKFAFHLFNARHRSGEGNVFSHVCLDVCLFPFYRFLALRSTLLPTPLCRAQSHWTGRPSIFNLVRPVPAVQDPGSSPSYQNSPPEHVQSSLT